MQIGPEQGAFMAMLVKLSGAQRILEIGTFTGYSTLAMALAGNARIVAADISKEWTAIARLVSGRKPVSPSGSTCRSQRAGKTKVDRSPAGGGPRGQHRSHVH